MGFASIAVGSLIGGGLQTCFGQTLIQDAQPTDVGFSRGEWSIAKAPVAAASAAPTQDVGGLGTQAGPTGDRDWRTSLLVGDRVITMRRDGDSQTVRYLFSDGSLDRDGYAVACYLLRDVRAGKLFPIDVRLLDQLCGLQRWALANGWRTVLRILSGFRTFATNASTEGAAMNSQHLSGRAVDFVLEGLPTSVVRAMVLEFNKLGGTGIYLHRDTVHADTGPPRVWVASQKR